MNLTYVNPLQHYEEPQSVDVTACGNTKFPIQVTNIIDDLYKCCNEFISISIEEAMNLENVTVRQFDCTEWFNQRKKRITASQFARVAKRKKQVNEKFLQSLFDPKKFSSAATSYGTANETVAKKQYAEKYKDNHLHDCGLVVNPGFSFLGATPDGKLCSNGTTGIIEIKCPYAVRDLKIEEAVVTANFCLQKNGDVLVMNKGHDHYYQVQGQLLLSGATFCEFIV
ncbi:unnamed protein product [Mytilus edulis]|uniref:YqaJ viral recombinase domain-containing protein n=1 Tax=Mytilus edulis TaxID=6550 RepID=A0A8S3SJB2_MYTED|nr:unnamed protein product [Mytilus edulis]